MSKIEEQNSGKKEGEIRYLTPLNIDTSVQKKYCRFKRSGIKYICLLYTSPSPRDRTRSRMPSSA